MGFLPTPQRNLISSHSNHLAKSIRRAKARGLAVFFRKILDLAFPRAVLVLRLIAPIFLLVQITGCGRSPKANPPPQLGSGDLRWPLLPLKLAIDSRLLQRDEAEDDLHEAVAFWESRAGKSLFLLEALAPGERPYSGPSENPTSLLKNAVYIQGPWPFDSHIAGKTFVHSEGSKIQNAVVFLNEKTDLCATLCDRDGDGERTSRRKLIAHELGHLLGFDHVSDRNNIMYPEILQGGSLDDVEIDQQLFQKLIR